MIFGEKCADKRIDQRLSKHEADDSGASLLNQFTAFKHSDGDPEARKRLMGCSRGARTLGLELRLERGGVVVWRGQYVNLTEILIQVACVHWYPELDIGSGD